MNNELDIKDILTSLGYKLRDDGKCWRTKALYRNGKNNNSLIIYKDTGCWNDYGSSLYSQPINKLLEFHGIKNFTKSNVISNNKEIVKEIDDAQIEKIYPESILSKLLPHYKFYNDRGISSDCLTRLKSGMAMSGKMYQRYVFPIYNKEHKIIGFSGRYMGNSLDKPKWKHLGKKRNWTYPLFVKDKNGFLFTKDAIKNSGELILVESIGDLLAFHTRGIFNVLVTFGLTCSPSSICSILQLNPEKIFICYNNDFEKGDLDNTGKIASIENFLNLLKYFDYNSIGICLPLKKDFGEMNDVDFDKWKNIKNNTDYNKQRLEICEEAVKLKNMKKITEKSFKNLGLLNCG
jgi:hypothetical protein